MAKGSVNIMRYGAGPNGVMRTLGNTMLGSGAAFGLVTSGSFLELMLICLWLLVSSCQLEA